MTWKCPACGVNGDGSNIVCICGYRDDSTSGRAHGNVQPPASNIASEELLDPATKRNISDMQTNIFFWGMLRLCLGAIVAVLIWIFVIGKGIIAVYPFAFSIAVALSGLLSVITRKSFSELSDAWTKIPGLLKLLIVIVGSIVLYVAIFIIGVSVTTK